MDLETEDMNLYLVVSEPLVAYIPCADSSYPEDYCIAELVVAETRDKAKYMAWKNDRDSFNHDIREMPKMQVRLKVKDVKGPARIASDEYGDDRLWSL